MALTDEALKERAAIVEWLGQRIKERAPVAKPNIEQAAHDGGYFLALIHVSDAIGRGDHLT